MSQIKVLLAEDHTIVRKGIRALLESAPDVTVVAEAGDGPEAIQLVETHKPDVVLMDISLPTVSGLEATRVICSTRPGVRVIVLTIHDNDEYVRQALKSGAVGYLVKDAGPIELLKAIHTVARGDRFFSAKVAHAAKGQIGHRSDDDSADDSSVRLTPRQEQVLQLVARGQSIQAIALTLSISDKTVRAHRLRLLEKLNLNSDVELTLFALRKGLIRLDD